MKFIHIPTYSVCALVFFFASECQAETVTFGPTPYLSEADSPFDLSGLGTTFFLEDFEDGELNSPGLAFSENTASVRAPNSRTDSVDGDDGQIDGDGSLGYSLQVNLVLAMHPLGSMSFLNLSFDPVFGNQLPNTVGFVMTDSGALADITINFYDIQDEIVASITESELGDGLDNGGTGEDRFFGVIHAGGISAISIKSEAVNGGSTFEIDHLQYGVAVREPSALFLLDIKPGSDSNPVNPKSKGVLSVAILGTADFDVNDVDIDTLLFGDPLLIDNGGTAVSPLRNTYRDVSHDGLLDLTLKFSTRDLVEFGALGFDTVEGLLTGELLDGTPFAGMDSIRIVPPNGSNGNGLQISSVPEPTTCTLALAALCLAISRRRSH